LEVLCEGGGVKEGLLRELLSEVEFEVFECVGVGGELDGFEDVLLFVLGDPLRMSAVVSDSLSDMGEEAIPTLGDDGDTHPESLGACGTTGVGERIESDVDAVIGCEQLGSRPRAFEQEPLWPDLMGGKALQEPLSDGGIGQLLGLQEQPSLGHPL
jgi:hypothetical protein